MTWTVLFHPEFEPEFEMMAESVRDELSAAALVLARRRTRSRSAAR